MVHGRAMIAGVRLGEAERLMPKSKRPLNQEALLVTGAGWADISVGALQERSSREAQRMLTNKIT